MSGGEGVGEQATSKAPSRAVATVFMGISTVRALRWLRKDRIDSLGDGIAGSQSVRQCHPESEGNVTSKDQGPTAARSPPGNKSTKRSIRKTRSRALGGGGGID